MKLISKSILGIGKRQYYETHLKIINPFLPVELTPKRLEVLAAFMALEGDIANDRFGTTARKSIKKELKLSNGGLGNYLKYYKEKNIIYIPENKTDYEIRPFMWPEPTSQGYQFKITKKND